LSVPLSLAAVHWRDCLRTASNTKPSGESRPATKITSALAQRDGSSPAHKRLLQAWDANPDFDFDFDSRGPDIAIDSTDATTVKQSLTRMMKSATHLLVLVGAKSAKSKWMQWEIDRAKQDDVRLKIAAVKLAKDNESPSGLLGSGTSWATSFERDRIIDALKKAK
jgi:hypothetical protein